LWYIKRNDFLRFETLTCPAIVLKFTRNFVPKLHFGRLSSSLPIIGIGHLTIGIGRLSANYLF